MYIHFHLYSKNLCMFNLSPIQSLCKFSCRRNFLAHPPALYTSDKKFSHSCPFGPKPVTCALFPRIFLLISSKNCFIFLEASPFGKNSTNDAPRSQDDSLVCDAVGDKDRGAPEILGSTAAAKLRRRRKKSRFCRSATSNIAQNRFFLNTFIR